MGSIPRVQGWKWGVRSLEKFPGATLLPTASSEDDGLNAENKFHIIQDVTISGTLEAESKNSAFSKLRFFWVFLSLLTMAGGYTHQFKFSKLLSIGAFEKRK